MDIGDKLLYYVGLVGIIAAVAVIIVGSLGIMTDGWTFTGKGIIGLVVCTGCFVRGYRARQQAKQREAQELLNKLVSQPNHNHKAN